ncbi:bifunctional DNA primase/polymerase [Streptomyces sp. SL13]|uniref:Bifunctional DNA primase/polymerase n=1 Tax=Streptantibioticus silvisoli TaxID=2705255 RepID=A0AA90H771_9ACTN|nr:bifunctional DNA primase/polymerase [Streptantibioticus silvisoli]MDI5971809.1 bifunctional DNA primase/polymerase [Streptantibioticus silvisoli]
MATRTPPAHASAADTVAAHLLDAALRYAEDRHWDVVPGTWLTTVDGMPRCSCGHPACASPGAHPVDPGWAGLATGSTLTVRRLWSGQPLASVLLPTGRAFDALDVSEAAGCLALARLERLGVPLGPVLCTPTRRVVFFVLPGSASKFPARLRRLGRPPASIDLVVHAAGGHVVAPPTRVGSAGHTQWVREPTAENRWLPDAESLFNAMVYAVRASAGLDGGRRTLTPTPSWGRRQTGLTEVGVRGAVGGAGEFVRLR